MISSHSSTSGRRPTLEDVAAAAGVSRALVSIVMRGAKGAGPETRERVLQIANDMGYRPDARARLLAGGTSSPLVGVVFRQFFSFHLLLLDGLYTAADDAGVELILSAETPNRSERRAAETLLDFRCDAAILLGQGGTPLLAGRLPVVVIGWHVKDSAVDVVRTSDTRGAQLAVDHLVQLGHRRIAHVDGGSSPISTARRAAYRSAMRRHGLGDYIDVIPGGPQQPDGVGAAATLLARPERPTAVQAFNDDAAAGLRQMLTSQGVRTPDHVSIVGWDDDPFASLPLWDLTTVRQDPVLMARLAIERSISRMDPGGATPDTDIVLTPQLIVRGSTGPPHPADRPDLSGSDHCCPEPPERRAGAHATDLVRPTRSPPVTEPQASATETAGRIVAGGTCVDPAECGWRVALGPVPPVGEVWRFLWLSGWQPTSTGL